MRPNKRVVESLFDWAGWRFQEFEIGKKTRSQIRQKSAELQDRATGTFDDLVALSHFDNRKILAGPR